MNGVTLERIRRYARGTSPIIGLPIFHISEGKFVSAIFFRHHLHAALSAPVTKAHYDERNHALVLNGGSAAYSLKNLRHTDLQSWQIREQLTRWASGKKKSVSTRSLDANQKRILKFQAEIKKLERAKQKIYATRPHSPMLLTEWDRQSASTRDREQELRWREEKPLRRKLGVLVRQERKTWAIFYREVEEIIGRSVDTSRRHDRVCNLKGGPDRLDYLKYIFKHIWMAQKPYERSSVWNPFRVYEYAGDENGLNRFQQHRRAQLEYLTAMRQKASIDSLIAGYRDQIREMETPSTVVPA